MTDDYCTVRGIARQDLTDHQCTLPRLANTKHSSGLVTEQTKEATANPLVPCGAGYAPYGRG